MEQGAIVTKPQSGHWTDAYPEMGRGPVSLEDCVSEEFCEKEREHVFRKTWLYVGRVERLPKKGSYFTRELAFANTSIQCEVWEGFIFINLNPDNTGSVRDFLGELAHGIEDYPFDGSHQEFFPNLVLIFGASGFTTHVHWPAGPHSHIIEVEMFYRPPTTHKERLGQELTVTFLNDIVLEDASPLEGMQAMLNSRAIKEFHLNDEELLVRHMRKVVGDWVTAGEMNKGGGK